MNEYRIETYGNGDRPGDVERLEEFIIQPKQPWFSEAEQRIVKKSLGGEMRNFYDRWCIARFQGCPVASAWFHLSEDCYRTGVLGYVRTDPDHRGNGLAQRVCKCLLDLAQKAGCQYMLLGTSNPAAAKVYERLGFESWYGGTMCWPAAWKDHLVSYDELGTVRSAQWSDLASLVRFIIEPQPQMLVDFWEGLTRQDGCLVQHRTVSTGAALLLRAEHPGHAMWVLVNKKNQIQGWACVSKHDGKHWLGVSVHPANGQGEVELLQTACRWLIERGIKVIYTAVTPLDEKPLNGLTSYGFTPVTPIDRGDFKDYFLHKEKIGIADLTLRGCLTGYHALSILKIG